MGVCLHLCLCTSCSLMLEEASEPQKLELQMIVSCHVVAFGTEPGSSARVATGFNHWAISPVLQPHLLQLQRSLPSPYTHTQVRISHRDFPSIHRLHKCLCLSPSAEGMFTSGCPIVGREFSSIYTAFPCFPEPAGTITLRSPLAIPQWPHSLL